MKSLLLSILALMLGVSAAGDDNEFRPEVRKAVETLDLKIRITTVMPTAGPMVNNSDTYTFTIKDGVANCDLPFYGESHTSVIYGIDETGIRLDNCPVKVKVNKTKVKKGKYMLEFKGRSGSDEWRFFIDVWSNGEVNISCNCPSKSGMNFIGELDFDE